VTNRPDAGSIHVVSWRQNWRDRQRRGHPHIVGHEQAPPGELQAWFGNSRWRSAGLHLRVPPTERFGSAESPRPRSTTRQATPVYKDSAIGAVVW
jgi:hypothetical protein